MELEIELLKRNRSSAQSEDRTCEWPDCEESGAHRAPISRDELHKFRWFCTLHAREYNRSWNYYEGMSDAEVEADVREDTVWHRPSWRLGTHEPGGGGFSRTYDHFRDPFDILKNAHINGNGKSTGTPDNLLTAEQRRALEIFELDRPGDIDSLKQRYKELVKRHHPDAKGTTAGSDEKMKDINQAYKILADFIAP